MSHEAALSTLLEVVARSQREVERLEAEREQSKLMKERARSFIRGGNGGQDGTRSRPDGTSAHDEGLPAS
jgi:hypothetical protein